jgi:hypothetical protein
VEQMMEETGEAEDVGNGMDGGVGGFEDSPGK